MDASMRKLMLTATAMAAISNAAHGQTAPESAIKSFLDGEPGSITAAAITVYGVIDANVVYQTHGTPLGKYITTAVEYPISKSSNRSQFTYAANGLSQSTIGIKGKQALADLTGQPGLSGWTVSFDLQMGFDPVTGTIADGVRSLTQQNGVDQRVQTSGSDSSRAGQVFNGEAWAGLKHDVLGELRFGRNNSLPMDAFGQYDPQKLSNAFSLFGYSGTLGGGLGATEDSRWNNSLKYRNTFGPVRVAAQYRFAGAGQGGEDYVFGLGLDLPGGLKGLSIDGIWGQTKGANVSNALSASQCGALGLSLAVCQSSIYVNGQISNNEVFALMAKYEASPALTVFGGWEEITNSNGAAVPRDTSIAGGYVLNPLTINVFNFKTDRVTDITWAGARYSFTPKLSGALAWYHIEQNAFLTGGAGTSCAAGTAANAINKTKGTFLGTATASNCAGSENLVSISLDYQATKRLDLYAGIEWSEVKGGLASGFLYKSTIDPTIGARLRF